MRPLQSRHMARLVLTLIAFAALAAGCGSDDDGGGNGGSPARDTAGEAAEAGAKERTRADEEGGRTGDAAAEDEPSGDAAAGDEPSGDAAGEGQTTADAAARPRRGPRLKLRDSQFGPVLFDGRNRALYLFTRDPRNKTRCYGACAEAWPPFYAKGRPRAGQGVDRRLIGTIERRDGRRQVTYKGRALYFYVADPRGQVLCNDVFEFGGTWYAVDAKGNPPT
jgi:predicted lipoprotein with Yx(FWY)xxD motif